MTWWPISKLLWTHHTFSHTSHQCHHTRWIHHCTWWYNMYPPTLTRDIMCVHNKLLGIQDNFTNIHVCETSHSNASQFENRYWGSSYVLLNTQSSQDSQHTSTTNTIQKLFQTKQVKFMCWKKQIIHWEQPDKQLEKKCVFFKSICVSFYV